MYNNYKRMNVDSQASIIAIITAIVGLVVIGIIALINTPPKKLSLNDEQQKCHDLMVGESIKKGNEGYCEKYIGSDGDLHYKYIQILDAYTKETKDIYFIWETGKVGRY